MTTPACLPVPSDACTLEKTFAVMACRCCAPLQSDDEGGDEVLLPMEPDAALAAATIFDSHNHIFADAMTARARRNFYGVVQAVEEDDWPRVLERCGASSRLRPGLGVHPWQAHLVEDVDAFIGRLATALAAHPAAIVGEIGLCKCAKNVRGAKEERDRGLAQQRRVFDAQLKLAARLGRPASVHAVKQHSPLKAALEAIHATPGFAVALHSFGGTAHHAKELLAAVDYPLFFGFSHTINVAMNGRRGLAALDDAIRAVPEDRLLVESDVDDASTARLATCRAVLVVAAARGWTPVRTAAVTSANARRWLDFE